jgi:hypothetical protein
MLIVRSNTVYRLAGCYTRKGSTRLLPKQTRGSDFAQELPNDQCHSLFRHIEIAEAADNPLSYPHQALKPPASAIITVFGRLRRQ